VNTLDPQYFEENIRAAYEARKMRMADKNDGEVDMDFEIYNLLKSSNQIVHNRGKALSYMNDKKRPREADNVLPRHQYEVKRSLASGALPGEKP
jgi:hypothetical protein